MTDGPYVFWKGDTGAEILRIDKGKAVRTTVEAEDAITVDTPFLPDGTLVIKSASPMVEPAVYENVSRIFVMGDVHGAFNVMVDLLRSCGVIDSEWHWSFGQGHLVFDGDVMDRGDMVTEVLWLIHRLEDEAKQAGGRVHLLLGNHEVMPLQNDVRYVNEKYIQHVLPALGLSFAELYGPETELGRWLRTKHSVIRINDVLFMHGGMSTKLSDQGWTIDGINRTIREHIDTPREVIKADEKLGLLFGSEGPLWYRGYFIDLSHYQRTTPERVRTMLDHFEANHVVVGHTTATQIHSIFDGMVINVHVWMEPGKPAEGLLWENGRFLRVNGAGLREELDFTNETWLDAEG